MEAVIDKQICGPEAPIKGATSEAEREFVRQVAGPCINVGLVSRARGVTSAEDGAGFLR
jgi:hypothetical protein